MSAYVAVIQAGIIEVDGQVQNVKVGEIFEADHPAVKRFSYLFGPVPVRFASSPKVEQATAAPGEKRKR